MLQPGEAEAPRRSRSLLGQLETARTPGEKADRRTARTRLALLEAAQRLFATRPLDGVSIDDITREADVAKGSLYNHFTSKEALAEELFRIVRRHVAERIDAAIHTSVAPPERLVRGAFVILRFSMEHPESASALLKLSPELLSDAAPLNRKLREIIVEGFASGDFRGMPIDTATLLVIGVMLVMLQDSVARQKPARRTIAKMTPLMAGALKALGVEGDAAVAAAKAAAKAMLENTPTAGHGAET